MDEKRKFNFYPRFEMLEGKKGITVENSHKLLNPIVKDQDFSLGNMQIGNRSYHVFYFKNRNFSVYYHGGGTDSLYSSESLDEVLDYLYNLDPKDFT